jgi:signal transduction histidine kinase
MATRPTPGTLSVVDPPPAPPTAERETPHQRSRRDWVVDTVAFLIALLAGAFLLAVAADSRADFPRALLVADLVAGSIACLALWLRRRWPVAVAIALAVPAAFSDMASPAALVMLFTVAVHRRWPPVLAVVAAHVVAGAVYFTARPDPTVPLPISVGFAVVVSASAVAWGMFVRARRQLVQSLRERADRAEAEQLIRVEQARHTERTRIAREMHDVLAHRISLLSMHAGALEFRPDAPPEEVARAAGVIRASARQALEDLREVIGVLREDADGVIGARPQPTLADLPALVEESRAAGMRVREEYRLPDLRTAPAATGRTAYRVVQEALTNVRKHAEGAVAVVEVRGGPVTGLGIEVRNPPRVGDRSTHALPSAGTGLIGLRERVTLAGGRLEHGWTPDGEFRLRADLPWPA